MIRRGRLLPLLILFALPFAPAVGPAVAEEKPDLATLRLLVRELNRLRLLHGAEEAGWRETRAHLETSRALLRKEREDLVERLAEIRERAKGTEGEEADLRGRIERAETALATVDTSVRACAARLLAVHGRLPAPLRTALGPAAGRVRESLAAEASSKGVVERLRLITAFSSDLDRTLGSVHAVKELLELGEGDRREVDVLYVGAIAGFWVGPLGKTAGTLRPENGAWRPERRDELAPTIRRALAILRKERPAALASLPIEIGKGR